MADSQSLAVKKVQNSIIDAASADPEFVDSVPQQIGQWPPQFVAKQSETFKSGDALLVGRRVFAEEFTQPISTGTSPRRSW
jgi:hypothetical protein